MLKIEDFQEAMNYRFQDEGLLREALTHSSYANEQKINKYGNYQRLEYLGDAVLELVSSEFIYNKHKEMTEGQMSKKRAAMVCEPSLAYCAREINLGAYIFLGRGEEASGGRDRDSILSDVLEAVIGAIFLDGGFDKAKDFIDKVVLEDIEDKQIFFDSKSLLQETVQGRQLGLLKYTILSEKGPEHEKTFQVEVHLNDRILAVGNGHNKKAAEQDAAFKAIHVLKES